MFLTFQNTVLQFGEQTSVKRPHTYVRVSHYKCVYDNFWTQTGVYFVGCEHIQNDNGVIIDYNISDPLIRWDSYENMSPDGEG